MGWASWFRGSRPAGPSEPLDFASLFVSSSPQSVLLPPDPSRHLPAQSGAPLCARAQPVHQSNAHRGGGVPSVKSYVAVCSNPPVHGGRRASSHWLLLAPTPTDPRVGLRSSFQAHGFLPSITPNQCRFSGGRVGETICNPRGEGVVLPMVWKYVVMDA